MDLDLFREKLIQFRDENKCLVHHLVTNLTCYNCGVRSGMTYIYQESVIENWGA